LSEFWPWEYTSEFVSGAQVGPCFPPCVGTNVRCRPEKWCCYFTAQIKRSVCCSSYYCVLLRACCVRCCAFCAFLSPLAASYVIYPLPRGVLTESFTTRAPRRRSKRLRQVTPFRTRSDDLNGSSQPQPRQRPGLFGSEERENKKS